jgi:hypothetical protein
VTRFPAGAAITAARRLACCAALLVGLSPVARAVPGSPAKSLIVERPESDVLLLALRLDKTTLAEGLPTYQDRRGVLVPLGEICRLLGLGINVDVGGGLVSGFFIDEKRLFSLDVVAQKVIFQGQPRRYDAAKIEVHVDDIYVDAELVSEWLPLHLDVDLYGSLITVRPAERLPLQLRLERESKLAKLHANPEAASAAYPKVELPYKLFDGPSIDQTLRYTRQPAPQGGSLNTLESTTFATGDLLFMAAAAFVSTTSRGISDSRFSLSRKDPDGQLLGFLGAREVTVGDVFHPGLDLIASPSSGPGLTVSNFPLQLPTQFDRQSFRGDLPPGWEVELYRGDELLAYAQSRPDGLYEFLDVPLLFGLNVFRLELYGPQGQHRSERRQLNVGDSLTPKGQIYYRLVGDDPSYHFVGTDRSTLRARSSFDLSAGLTKNLSASASLASVDLAGGIHTYAKTGLRGFWGRLFANVDFAADQAGGSAWQATLQSRLGPFGLLVERAQLNQFVSEFFLTSEPLRSRTDVRLDTAVPETFLPRLPLIVELKEDQLVNGQRLDLLSGRVSAFSRGLFLANQVSWSLASGGPSPPPSNATGQLLVSEIKPAFALRGEVDYDLKPDREVTGVAVTAETPKVKGFLLSAGISRMIQMGETRYLAGVSKLEGAFGFVVTAGYSQAAGLGVSALLSVSVGRDPRNGQWHPQARPLAGSGGLSGRAFLDTNGNGRMDPGEQTIPGAGFLLNGAGSLARTNDAGGAFIPNLPSNQALTLGLDTSTLEDPFWKPTPASVRVVPRPGKVAVIDFPVQISGEITGTVYQKRDGKNREASGVELDLVDRQGAVVTKVRSAYDGFYDLTGIAPGHYTLRVAAEQAARLHLVAPPARDVEMVPGGTVLDGVNFVLEAETVGEAKTPPS